MYYEQNRNVFDYYMHIQLPRYIKIFGLTNRIEISAAFVVRREIGNFWVVSMDFLIIRIFLHHLYY